MRSCSRGCEFGQGARIAAGTVVTTLCLLGAHGRGRPGRVVESPIASVSEDTVSPTMSQAVPTQFVVVGERSWVYGSFAFLN